MFTVDFDFGKVNAALDRLTRAAEAVLPDGKRQWVDLVCTVTNADL